MSAKDEASGGAPQIGNPGGNPAAQKGLGLAMFAIIIAVFMAILDTSIVNVAIPKMMAVYGVSQNEIEWVVTAYSLVSGALIPVTGYLGDRFGYKKMFLIANVLFTIGSALCGIAWSNDSMILFRIFQAVGGGALMPISMAMIFRMFPPERRGMAMGLFGVAIMFAPATGPTLSGYIVEYLDWRLIFTINVPIGIFDFFLALAVLKEFKAPTFKKFDFWGFITSSTGLASLLYGVGKVAEKGWTDSEVLIFVGIGSLCLVLFVVIELLIDNPMLDLSLLKNFTFTLSLVLSSIATIIMMGVLFLLPVFLQNLSGLSAVQTGLILLPQSLMVGVMMPIAGALFDKIGARIIGFLGMLITGWSLFLTAQLDVNTSYSTIIIWLVIRAIGMGLMMMPIQTAGMNTVPMMKMGQGTALSNTVRQISASFGIAWLSLLFAQRKDFHAASLSEEMNMFHAPVADGFAKLVNQYVAMGQSAVQAQANAIGYLSGQVQLNSVIQGLDDVFIVTGVLSVASAFLALFLKGKSKGAGGEKVHVMGE
ncbi:DHA2 family efflux MFS transporter permease subunit [Paenibacillus thalictri]|uniref:DHA2 family efflux MFS transporter permease subunit n=1 Tax=Paenibacillus thalictri TaxID=2527873 RepID=A0A4Q9DX68_9BACL|nr:DHA2 family efflux MFS transporter permease subunit [Paenibacillus thalictri]TBL81707.1 DHA2 family efflux MFS transporter permease subunit [Paenibacillus thalictri]